MTKLVACAMLAAVAALACSRGSPETAAAAPYERAAYEDLRPEEQALVDNMLETAKDPDGQYGVFSYGRELGYMATPHPALAEIDALLACENPAVLEVLMQRGSGSVRLYGLVLMKDQGHERLAHWMRVLGEDTSRVTMSNGCMVGNIRTIAEVAGNAGPRSKLSFRATK